VAQASRTLARYSARDAKRRYPDQAGLGRHESGVAQALEQLLRLLCIGAAVFASVSSSLPVGCPLNVPHRTAIY
jgi:hypothetical protein